MNKEELFLSYLKGYLDGFVRSREMRKNLTEEEQGELNANKIILEMIKRLEIDFHSDLTRSENEKD